MRKNTERMSEMDWQYLLKEIKGVMGDAVAEVIERHCVEEISLAQQRQKKRDIQKAICAFIELKQTDSVIYGLLNDYFGVANISEVREYVRKARTNTQIKRLRIYCAEAGMASGEFRRYAVEHDLEERLNANPKLAEMSPEKLKAFLDKN